MSRPASGTPGMVHPPPPPPIEHGWGGAGSAGPLGSPRPAAFTGLIVLLASSAMVFAAFTGAFAMRRGLSGDWVGTPKPGILWVNTAVLLISSLALDRSRYALRAGDRGRFNLWWTAATALGGVFLLGQAYAWRRLAESGVYVSANPSSSFFYVLTAAHAVHLVGGLAALIWVDVQARRLRLGPAKRTAIDVTAVFWHFLDGLWVYLMVLLCVWG